MIFSELKPLLVGKLLIVADSIPVTGSLSYVMLACDKLKISSLLGEDSFVTLFGIKIKFL
jgi:hypothetical protein